MLAMKRFMTNIIGTDADKPKRQQQQQPKFDPAGGAGVTFVSPDKKLNGDVAYMPYVRQAAQSKSPKR